jgi:hypothetical protein
LLAGVAYYQIKEGLNSKTLIFHGPKSVYEKVVHAVLSGQKRN